MKIAANVSGGSRNLERGIEMQMFDNNDMVKSLRKDHSL